MKAKTKRLLQFFLVMAMVLGVSAPVFAQVSIGISVRIGPPALPVYEQPICPGPNYIWVPGYWAWDGYDYYWVPGTWVLAPQPGYLWTPGYWGWNEGFYVWHPGYWGPHIGFYGGINYGYGYFGSGYEGGYWRGNNFYYNTAINRVNTTVIKNVYVNKTVINNVNVTRVSYNGGQGGVMARPTQQELVAEREHHIAPTQAQQTHMQMARQVPGNFYKQNHGTPVAAALARPAASVNDFHRNAIAARPVSAPVNNRGNQTMLTGRPAQTRPAPMQQNRPAARPQVQQQRPQTRPAPEVNRPQQMERPQPQQRQETRPAPQMQRPQTERQQPQSRPQTYSQPRQETRPAPQMRPESRPQPQPQARPEPQPHAEQPHGGGRFGR
jgi:hypothetical protein